MAQEAREGKGLMGALRQIPPVVLRFLVTAAVLFLGWQLLYHFVLSGRRIPDRQLTDLTTWCTERALSLFYAKTGVLYSDVMKTRQDIITIADRKIVAVGDACNALEIYVLYISFLFCYPATLSKRLLFILIGLPYIFFINVARVLAIIWLNIHHRSWVDVSHHYIFTTLVYLLVFYLWIQFTKKRVPVEE